MADTVLPSRVVVADDEPDLRWILVTLLRRYGFDVVGAAANGQEAVRLVRQTNPAAIVLDVSMPVMSGIEALEVIRREQPSICTVMWAADPGERSAATAGGADAWVTKGGGIAEIVEAVTAVLSRPRGE